ncbi:MAG: hypothetical protein HZA88_08740 [Verrucomicrobia bacterium]|nr:hypothetical protein [Verrucomicrobiota bacterium]
MTVKSGQLLVDEIIPRITAVVVRSAKRVGCEDVEEVTRDTIAMAVKMLSNIERAGKVASHDVTRVLKSISCARRKETYGFVAANIFPFRAQIICAT